MQALTSFDPDATAALRARGEFFWLDLTGAAPEQVERMRRALGVVPAPRHEPGTRRRLFVQAGDHVVVVCRGADLAGDAIRPFEVTVWVHGDFVVTVHDEPVEELERLRERLARRSGQSEEHVVAKVIDAVTDSYYAVLEDLDARISDVEDEVIEQPARSQLEDIARLQRALVMLRREVNPLRDVLRREGDEIAGVPGLEHGARDYLRALADDMGRISEQLDALAGLLANAVDVYLSRASNQLNEVTRRLTVVATIFLPLTFVTGFFGQNFGWLVRHIDGRGPFLIWGVGGLVASVLALVAWFRVSRLA